MNRYSYTCHYGQCWLPKNNSKYGWQIAFLVISLAVLWSEVESFSFFPIFLFTVPIMIDIITSELKSKIWNAIRVLFGIGNGVILIFCILGFAKVIVDNRDSFAFVTTFMFLGQLSISKTYMGIVLAFDILVPIIFLIGAPSQKTLRMLEVGKRMIEERGVKHR